LVGSGLFVAGRTQLLLFLKKKKKDVGYQDEFMKILSRMAGSRNPYCGRYPTLYVIEE